MVKFFFIPKEVWYYVVVPIALIILVYFIFWLFYRKRKDTYYYNYVVDYVYSTLGIVFCALLLCLLLGYSIATIETLFETNLINQYLVIVILLTILPIIPACFLGYVIKIYVKNLKRKEKLDLALENNNSNNENDFTFGHQDNNEIPTNNVLEKDFNESEYDLIKKK